MRKMRGAKRRLLIQGIIRGSDLNVFASLNKDNPEPGEFEWLQVTGR